MRLEGGMDCGCGVGKPCRLSRPEELIAFADAIKALVKANMKTLGKCQECGLRGAITAVPVDLLHLDWRRKYHGKTWLSLCGQCWKLARKAMKEPNESDAEELF